jgi:hypothetical protein
LYKKSNTLLYRHEKISKEKNNTRPFLAAIMTFLLWAAGGSKAFADGIINVSSNASGPGWSYTGSDSCYPNVCFHLYFCFILKTAEDFN